MKKIIEKLDNQSYCNLIAKGGRYYNDFMEIKKQCSKEIDDEFCLHLFTLGVICGKQLERERKGRSLEH